MHILSREGIFKGKFLAPGVVFNICSTGRGCDLHVGIGLPGNCAVVNADVLVLYISASGEIDCDYSNQT